MSPSAVDVAARALARRDRCEADLRRILARKGISETDAEDAVAKLRDLGVLDDARFAATAAEAFAARGYGDQAIISRLQRDGVDRDLALVAVSQLEPETDRAVRLAERRDASVRTARWLASRGFATDAIEETLRLIADLGQTELR
jgi:SOS response regulatory protein OraA/RecX